MARRSFQGPVTAPSKCGSRSPPTFLFGRKLLQGQKSRIREELCPEIKYLSTGITQPPMSDRWRSHAQVEYSLGTHKVWGVRTYDESEWEEVQGEGTPTEGPSDIYGDSILVFPYWKNKITGDLEQQKPEKGVLSGTHKVWAAGACFFAPLLYQDGR